MVKRAVSRGIINSNQKKRVCFNDLHCFITQHVLVAAAAAAVSPVKMTTTRASYSDTTSLYAIASASLCLPQSPQHYPCLSWYSTCWPFPLEFPQHLSSTESYTDFKSNLKTHLFSGASISGPLQIISTRFWFDIIMLIFASCNYIMLCYYVMKRRRWGSERWTRRVKWRFTRGEVNSWEYRVHIYH